MQTTVTLDEKLIEKAQGYTGLSEPSELIREALKALIEREAFRRAIKLGGSDPSATLGPRRRVPAE